MTSLCRLASVALLVGSALALAGCGTAEIEGPYVRVESDGSTEDLERFRERWQANGFVGYSMVEQLRCFCPMEALRPTRLEVENGQIVSLVDAETGEPVDPQFHDGFRTIDQLFELIETAIEKGAARIDVIYHRTVGIPLEIYIDYSEALADEEIGYSIISFESR